MTIASFIYLTVIEIITKVSTESEYYILKLQNLLSKCVVYKNKGEKSDLVKPHLVLSGTCNK